ncbi:MAG: ABC transporter permease [Thermoguttaceae bacterium]
MIADIRTMMWKELREIMIYGGGRGKAGLLIFVVGIGVFLPLQMGRDWIKSPIMLFLGVWMPLALVISVVADSFAGERERHTLETLLASRLSDRAILCGKAGAAMAYGVGASWVILLLGLVTVNLAHGHGKPIFFSATMGFSTIGFSLLNAGLATSAGILVSLRAATVRQAQQTLSIVLMAFLFGGIFSIQALPAEWKDSLVKTFTAVGVERALAFMALILTVLDVGLFAWAMKRFRRSRLIFD